MMASVEHNSNVQIKFKTAMLESSLCDCSDAYIPFKGAIRITRDGADATAIQADETNKQLALKNCAPFNDYINEIDNTEVDNAKDLVVLMLMYNLIEYSNNCSKTSGICGNIVEMSQMLL